MARSIGPGDVLAFWRVHRAIRPMRPDVVHAHGAKGGIYGRLSARLLSRKGPPVAAFYAPHGGSMHYSPRSIAGRIYFRVERAMEAATDGLIHVSAYEAATYREKVGVPQCPAHVVRNGLASGEFVPVLPKVDAADFLYIGMLRDLKGVDVFIEAMAEISRTASGRDGAHRRRGRGRGRGALPQPGRWCRTNRSRAFPCADAGARRLFARPYNRGAVTGGIDALHRPGGDGGGHADHCHQSRRHSGDSRWGGRPAASPRRRGGAFRRDGAAPWTIRPTCAARPMRGRGQSRNDFPS